MADAPDARAAIVALRAANGQEIAGTRARLLDEHGIVTTAGAVTRAPREMTEPLLRISPHVDCTPEDLSPAAPRPARPRLNTGAGRTEIIADYAIPPT